MERDDEDKALARLDGTADEVVTSPEDTGLSAKLAETVRMAGETAQRLSVDGRPATAIATATAALIADSNEGAYVNANAFGTSRRCISAHTHTHTHIRTHTQPRPPLQADRHERDLQRQGRAVQGSH